MLLVGLGGTACSEDTDAPSRAGSMEAFCTTFPGFTYDIPEAAAVFEEVGPLPNMSESARMGMQFIIDNAEELDRESDVFGDRAKFERLFGKEAPRHYLALLKWSGRACAKDLLESQFEESTQ